MTGDNETIITAQTDADQVKAGSESGDVAGSPDVEEEVVFHDGSDDTNTSGTGAAGDDHTAEEPEKAQKRVQTKAENAAFAAKRREAETAKRVKDAETRAVIEALNGVNPYTGKPMRDAFDVDEFRRMRAIDKRGGDAAADYADEVKNQLRADEAERARQAKEAEWYRNDLADFKSKHKDVDLQKLIEDPAFSRYADGKIGKKALSQIYEDYGELCASIQKSEQEKANRQAARAKASPGALGDANDNNTGFYTPDQVRSMSPSEVRKNYEKIQESMKRWI